MKKGLCYHFTSEDLVDCSRVLRREHEREYASMKKQVLEFNAKSDEEIAEIAGLPESPGYEPGQPRHQPPNIVRENAVHGMRKRIAFLEYAMERAAFLEGRIPKDEVFELDLTEIAFVFFGALMKIAPLQGFRAVHFPDDPENQQ